MHNGVCSVMAYIEQAVGVTEFEKESIPVGLNYC
jgi:hypothetical protein